MKKCAGVPVFRVCPKAKDYRGVGATGYCVECNQRTNTFCIIYKKWLCNIQLAVNQSMQQKEGSKLNKQDPKYVLITFDDGKVTDNKSAQYTHVGTSPIKLALKQTGLRYGHSKVMKMVKFPEYNPIF